MSKNMRSRFLVLCAIVPLGLSVALAESISSVRDFSDQIKSVRKGRLSVADITLLDVRISRETMSDILKRLGSAQTFRKPVGSVNDEICYSANDPADGTRVFFGFGPMGGWTHVTEFQVLSDASNDLPCTSSAGISRAVSNQSGIHLGMPLKELTTKLGRPTLKRKGFVSYSFEQESDHPKRAGFVILSGLDATIANDRVTSFRVFLIESN